MMAGYYSFLLCLFANLVVGVMMVTLAKSAASIPGISTSVIAYPNIKCSFDGNGRGKYYVSAMRDYAESNSGNSWPPESFLHSLFNDVIRSLKSIFILLWEQPGQLKCIEWPSFPSTLKTATLTLVLMSVPWFSCLFIVALSGVDAVLHILLGFTLRKRSS